MVNRKRKLSTNKNNDVIEECPICFEELLEKDVCVPENCVHHIFCVRCLTDWTKNKISYLPRCPMCRKIYKKILLKASGKVILVNSLNITLDRDDIHSSDTTSSDDSD